MNRLRNNLRLMRGLCLLPLCLLLALLFLMACSSIDCPVQNRVYTVYALTHADGTEDTLKVDTLTITTRRSDGNDTTLLNRMTSGSSFELSISYTQPEDTFCFTLRDTLGNIYRDTIWLKKENYPHFESVDCQAAFFHLLTAIRSTHHIIDTLSINNPNVNYDASDEHFHICLKDRY